MMESKKVKSIRKRYSSHKRLRMRDVRRGVSESSNEPGEEGTAINPQLPALSQPEVQSVSDSASDGVVTAGPSLDCAVDIVGAVKGEDEGSGDNSEGGGGGGESSGGSDSEYVQPSKKRRIDVEPIALGDVCVPHLSGTGFFRSDE